MCFEEASTSDIYPTISHSEVGKPKNLAICKFSTRYIFHFYKTSYTHLAYRNKPESYCSVKSFLAPAKMLYRCRNTANAVAKTIPKFMHKTHKFCHCHFEEEKKEIIFFYRNIFSTRERNTELFVITDKHRIRRR